MAYISKIRGFAIIGLALFKQEHFKRKVLAAIKANDKESERKYIAAACNVWSDEVLRAFDVDLQIINPDNIPKEGPVVYIANHQGYFDLFVFHYAVPHQIGFISKKEWDRIPFFRQWIRLTRCVYIDRGNMRESLKSINKGVELLKEGYSMVIFPEGTRSKTGKMGEMKPGAFKLAEKAKVPIIPVSIDGSRKCYEDNDKFTTGQTIRLTFHEAVPTAGLSRKELSEIPSKVVDIISKDLER